MKFDPIEIKDKLGRPVILRNAGAQDSESLIRYMKITTAETPFLIREPDEFCLTSEEEEAFINGRLRDERELLLIATINGEHIGNCSLMRVGSYRRYRHRCEVALALYQKYCGIGIGKAMLETVLSVAKETGYEQAELEVIRNNIPAIRLYQKLGFKEYGAFPDNMKYADGTYADALWMMKKL